MAERAANGPVEQLLRETEERLRLALEASGTGIWEWNVLTDTIRWDAQMFRIYGMQPTPDGMVSYATWSTAVLPEDLPEQERILRNTVNQGGGSKRAFRIRLKDAQVRHIEAVEAVRCNSTGNVEWVVGTNIDVTERREVEQRLREAVVTRDEFLAVASHELRTPLTALELQLDTVMRMFASSLVDGDRDRMKRKVEIAVRQTDRLTTLVDRLLNVSRIAAGAFQLDLEDFDMIGVVREVVERFEEQASRAGSRILVRVPATVDGRWDRLRVDQMITSLLSNAIKFGGGNGITVALAVDAERAILTVQDDGIGIAQQDLERIFDRFQRAVSPKHYGGLGLGLYVAKEIVSAHGGTIGVSSLPKQGTTFMVVLPRRTNGGRTASTSSRGEQSQW